MDIPVDIRTIYSWLMQNILLFQWFVPKGSDWMVIAIFQGFWWIFFPIFDPCYKLTWPPMGQPWNFFFFGFHILVPKKGWVRLGPYAVFLTAFQVENDTAGTGNGSKDCPEISREVTLGSCEDSGEGLLWRDSFKLIFFIERRAAAILVTRGI